MQANLRPLPLSQPCAELYSHELYSQELYSQEQHSGLTRPSLWLCPVVASLCNAALTHACVYCTQVQYIRVLEMYRQDLAAVLQVRTLP